MRDSLKPAQVDAREHERLQKLVPVLFLVCRQDIRRANTRALEAQSGPHSHGEVTRARRVTKARNVRSLHRY